MAAGVWQSLKVDVKAAGVWQSAKMEAGAAGCWEGLKVEFQTAGLCRCQAVAAGGGSLQLSARTCRWRL